MLKKSQLKIDIQHYFFRIFLSRSGNFQKIYQVSLSNKNRQKIAEKADWWIWSILLHLHTCHFVYNKSILTTFVKFTFDIYAIFKIIVRSLEQWLLKSSAMNLVQFSFSFTFEEKQILHSPNQEVFSTDTFRVATA